MPVLIDPCTWPPIVCAHHWGITNAMNKYATSARTMMTTPRTRNRFQGMSRFGFAEGCDASEVLMEPVCQRVESSPRNRPGQPTGSYAQCMVSTSGQRSAGRLIAIGDSFTEGVGDDNDAFPNGVRGWADRVAKQLGKADPGWQYANLGIRSFRLREVVAHQLSPALAMADGTDRTIITCFAGANDVLDLPTEMAEVAAGVDALIARLAATGATVVLFTSYDVKVTPLLEP